MNVDHNFSRYSPARVALVFSCLVLFVGFFYSRFLLSIGQILFCTTALWNFWQGGEESAMPRGALLAFLLLFTAALLCFWYTEHWGLWLERLRIRLPYLILPVAFVFLPSISRWLRQRIGLLYLALAASSCLYVFFLYLNDPEGVQQVIEIGGHFPLRVNHIRFSLVLGIAVLYGLHLLRAMNGWGQRLLIGSLTILCFTTLHLLAVRSGLLAMYFGLFFWWLYIVFLERKWRWLLALPVVLFLLLGAWYTIPSFQLKLGYTYWELMELIGRSDQATTLSARMQSYTCGWQVFLEQPFWGTGVGDLREAMAKCWVMNFGYDSMYMPHNQYLSWLAGNGLFFALPMFVVCLLPVFYVRKDSLPLVASVIIALLISFMVENTIENSFGVAIHSFFSLWFLRFHSKSN